MLSRILQQSWLHIYLRVEAGVRRLQFIHLAAVSSGHLTNTVVTLELIQMGVKTSFQETRMISLL